MEVLNSSHLPGEEPKSAPHSTLSKCVTPPKLGHFKAHWLGIKMGVLQQHRDERK